jgi:hypothetical protein
MEQWQKEASEYNSIDSTFTLTQVFQGLLQNQLIMRTFAFAHVKDLEDIEDRSDEKPIGALILSMQAVRFS